MSKETYVHKLIYIAIDLGIKTEKTRDTETTKIGVHVRRQLVLPSTFIYKPPAVVMATGWQAAKKKHFPIRP